MSDWIDEEMERRRLGSHRSLDQSQHGAINSRYYPGTRQLCVLCHEPTGRCEEDSMGGDDGPLCESCYAATLIHSGGEMHGTQEAIYVHESQAGRVLTSTP